MSWLIEYCLSPQGQTSLIVWGDLAIALAYFAIPFIMLMVLRDRKTDIPYPWLWTLFVLFIVACGMTHLVHVWSFMMGVHYVAATAVITLITAVVSVATAVVFCFILPQIKLLPSPEQQRLQLELLVAERTREKNALIREINHRIGNQLQVLSSLISIENRRASEAETHEVLGRIRAELSRMGEQHRTMSDLDYVAARAIDEKIADEKTVSTAPAPAGTVSEAAAG